MPTPLCVSIVGGTADRIGQIQSELSAAGASPQVHLEGPTPPPFEPSRRGCVVLCLFGEGGAGLSRDEALGAIELWGRGPAPVIAIGPGLSAELVLAAMRRGAADCLDWDHIHDLAACVQRVLTNADRQWRRDQADEAAVGERRVLRLIAGGAALATTLDALVRTIEQQFPEMRCSILLLDESGERLLCGAAPSLPDEYNLAIHGIRIGPRVGSCGTAAFERRRVVVTDVATDPLWSDYRDLALAHGLRACWSQPIFSSKERILGTFACYYLTPRSPDEFESSAMKSAADLAGIAIERQTALDRESLRRAELAHAARLSAVGQMMAGIAHEIAQPLYAMTNFAQAAIEVLERRAAPELDSVLSWTRAIATQAGRAGDVVRRLVAFARKPEPRRTTFDAAAVVAEAVEMLLGDLRRRQTRVTIDDSLHGIEIHADRVLLAQVFINLIGNAAEAARDVAAERREIVVRRGPATSEAAVIEIVDWGVGVPAAERERIFEPFRTTRPDGLGMGLAISRSIVESHGGQLTLASDELGPTVFRLTLPAGRHNDVAEKVEAGHAT